MLVYRGDDNVLFKDSFHRRQLSQFSKKIVDQGYFSEMRPLSKNISFKELFFQGDLDQWLFTTAGWSAAVFIMSRSRSACAVTSIFV